MWLSSPPMPDFIGRVDVLRHRLNMRETPYVTLHSVPTTRKMKNNLSGDDLYTGRRELFKLWSDSLLSSAMPLFVFCLHSLIGGIVCALDMKISGPSPIRWIISAKILLSSCFQASWICTFLLSLGSVREHRKPYKIDHISPWTVPIKRGKSSRTLRDSGNSFSFIFLGCF